MQLLQGEIVLMKQSEKSVEEVHRRWKYALNSHFCYNFACTLRVDRNHLQFECQKCLLHGGVFYTILWLNIFQYIPSENVCCAAKQPFL